MIMEPLIPISCITVPGFAVSLMANIITLQTVVAFFTIPVWLNVGNRLLW